MSHIHNLGAFSVDRYQGYLDRMKSSAAERRPRISDDPSETLTFDSAIDAEREGDSGGQRQEEAPQQDDSDDGEHHELNEQA